MDSTFFKELFRKYYDRNFDKYEIIKNEYNIDYDKIFEINLDEKIYYNVFNLKNCNIKFRIKNDKKSMIYNEFNIEGNVKIDFLIENNGELYFYNLYNIKNKSYGEFLEKIYNEKKVVIISKILIDKDSENSEGKLNQILLEENGISILLPILDVKNDKSKGFHGSKLLKLNKEEINYLRYLSLDENKINELLIKDFMNI
ncbi:hypothetical protein YN1_6520 [Nanoarchaeota archaeon]